MTLGEDRLIVLNAKQFEKSWTICSYRNQDESIKWVKKYESQVGELDPLTLKTTVLYDYRDEEIYMTQSDGFDVADLISVKG